MTSELTLDWYRKNGYEARRRRAFVLSYEWERQNPKVSLLYVLGTGRSQIKDEWAVMRYIGAKDWGECLDSLSLGYGIRDHLSERETEESLIKSKWLPRSLVSQVKKVLESESLQYWVNRS